MLLIIKGTSFVVAFCFAKLYPLSLSLCLPLPLSVSVSHSSHLPVSGLTLAQPLLQMKHPPAVIGIEQMFSVWMAIDGTLMPVAKQDKNPFWGEKKKKIAKQKDGGIYGSDYITSLVSHMSVLHIQQIRSRPFQFSACPSACARILVLKHHK